MGQQKILKMTTMLAVVAASSVAAGQVRRLDYGRALDASPLVGAGGRNVQQPMGDRVNSQLYVTGQVTGLGRFRGNIGYRAGDQLRLTLPSEGLDDFRRRAVGMGSALGGRPYRTSPYFDPLQTTFSLRTFTSDFQSLRRAAPPEGQGTLSQRLYTEATEGYEVLLEETAAGSRRRGLMLDSDPLEWDSEGLTRGFVRPPSGEGSLFDRAEADDEGGKWRGPLEEDGEELPEGYVDLRVDSTAEPRATTGHEMPPEAGERPGAPLPSQIRPDAMPETAADVAPNEDVYMDLLIRQQELQSGRRIQRLHGAEAEPGEDEPEDGDVPEEAERGAQQPLVEITDGVITIHSLAGQRANAFNARMARAQRLLRAGEFYRSAESFQVATMMSPNRPLPRAGRALAMLLAGEPLAAALGLRESMELYPPLMESRLDLARLAGDQFPLLTRRLAELDGRIGESVERPSERSFALLSAYLHRCLGQEEPARAQARKLADSDEADTLSRTFARRILGEEADEADGEDAPPEEEPAVEDAPHEREMLE